MRTLNPNQGTSNDLASKHNVARIKEQVHRQLLETMDMFAARDLPPEQLTAECSRRAEALLAEQAVPLTAPERQRILREVIDDIFGLGPLQDFLRDPTVSDILVNGPHLVYIERGGLLERTNARFRDDDHLKQVIQRIAADIGRRIDESSPMLDARLKDGSRVNAVIPPLALDGPAMSIRRFGTVEIDEKRLIELGTLTDEMAQFLEACVVAQANILISGGTGAGKTTLLNLLSKWIPDQDRVVTIEDAAELKLLREHVVRLETRPPNIEGKGQVTQRELLRNALRMRPDRIIIGEVRGAEAIDMLQAMNTGHEGSMTTVHANNVRDATRRVENMVSMSGVNFPVHVIRQQMTSALNFVIQLERMTGGKRRLTSIAEVTGMEGEQICLQELFVFKQTGLTDDGHAKGHFEAGGVRPHFLERIRAEGMEIDENLFKRRVIGQIDGNGR